MKTVPTLRVVSKADARAKLAGLGVVDLPDEVQLVLADVASPAPDQCPVQAFCPDGTDPTPAYAFAFGARGGILIA